MIALLGRLAYQLIENQFAMLLECAQALFKRKEQRLRQLWGLARVKRVLNDYTLANDLDRQFGDVPIGLGKILLFLSAIHGFAGNPRGQFHWAQAGPYVSWRWRLGPARFGSYFGGASVSTARAACPLSASAAVTAVTGYSSNSPLFFGRPICASRSRLGLSWSCVAPWQVLTRHVAVAGRGANRAVHRCRPDATIAVPILTAAAPSNCLPGAVTGTPRRSCVRTGSRWT